MDLLKAPEYTGLVVNVHSDQIEFQHGPDTTIESEPERLTSHQWFEANYNELLKHAQMTNPFIFILTKAMSSNHVKDVVRESILQAAHDHLEERANKLGGDEIENCDCIRCVAINVAIKHIKSST